MKCYDLSEFNKRFLNKIFTQKIWNDEKSRVRMKGKEERDQVVYHTILRKRSACDASKWIAGAFKFKGEHFAIPT